MPEGKYKIFKHREGWVLRTPEGFSYWYFTWAGAVHWFNWYLGSWGHSEVTVDPPERKIADEG